MIPVFHLARRWQDSTIWHERKAAESIRRGHFKAIGDRAQPEELYLLRMWLSLPVADERDEGGFSSSSSLLLHYIAKPDADPALHDHPWDFEAQILAGGYIEETPGFGWEPGSFAGPRLTRRAHHGVGAVIRHAAADLHRIAYVQPETWTIVETGPRVRPWGFHPAGQAWQEFKP